MLSVQRPGNKADGMQVGVWFILFISGTVSGTQDMVHKYLLNERLIFDVKGDIAGQLRSLCAVHRNNPTLV